jgi:transposase-like protein
MRARGDYMNLIFEKEKCPIIEKARCPYCLEELDFFAIASSSYRSLVCFHCHKNWTLRFETKRPRLTHVFSRTEVQPETKDRWEEMIHPPLAVNVELKRRAKP